MIIVSFYNKNNITSLKLKIFLHYSLVLNKFNIFFINHYKILKELISI